MCLQAAERGAKLAAADVEEHKKHIATLEQDLEAATGRARSLEAELRRQAAAVREADTVKEELQEAMQQCEDWRGKHGCGHGGCRFVLVGYCA